MNNEPVIVGAVQLWALFVAFCAGLYCWTRFCLWVLGVFCEEEKRGPVGKQARSCKRPVKEVSL